MEKLEEAGDPTGQRGALKITVYAKPNHSAEEHLPEKSQEASHVLPESRQENPISCLGRSHPLQTCNLEEDHSQLSL
jgi:hypothetical protein